MKIKIIGATRKIAIGQIHPIDRARKELSDLGYEFTDKKPDLVLIQTDLLKSELKGTEELILSQPCPVVILDSAASTGTHKIRYVRLYPDKVIGYIKKQLLVDRSLYKIKYPRSRWHYYILSDLSKNLNRETKEDKDATDEVLSKVHLGWNLALMNRHGMDTSREINWKKKRNIDIHFSVKTKHSTKVEKENLGKIDDHYAFHRASCETLLDEITKKNGFTLSGKCKGEDYINKMLDSKVCVSPLGLGEICFRDLEAVCCGLILIKPDMSHLETWPNVYIPWKTYIPVKWDWSDLEEILVKVLKNHKRYRPIAIEAFRVLKESWNNKVFAERFDKIMKEIVE